MCEPLNDQETETNKTQRVFGYGVDKKPWQDKRLNLKLKS